MILIAELATAHGGDVELAADMIRAAAEAGATYAKVQTYSLERLNPKDPQRDWLIQSHLDRAAHERLIQVAQEAGVQFLSTPFDPDSLQMLRELGLTTFKIASSESQNPWWLPLDHERWFVSLPWGHGNLPPTRARMTALTAIPLYPTPLECIGRATLQHGWSDHGEGNDACYWAIAQGIQVLEVHMGLPDRGRQCVWDKWPSSLMALRHFGEACETVRSGVATKFRERWQHA